MCASLLIIPDRITFPEQNLEVICMPKTCWTLFSLWKMQKPTVCVYILETKLASKLKRRKFIILWHCSFNLCVIIKKMYWSEKKKLFLYSPVVVCRFDSNNMLSSVDSKSSLLKRTFCKAVTGKYIYLR